jgi:DNA ligase D-like protein (predicted 3'-phosphoesterase)
MKRFVVQEHQATHLHWDFRIELNGVLVSWAVPKQPPLEPGIRRLAVRVENHDIGYIDFQGNIPEGQYGAGTVRIWDNGEYVLEEEGERLFKLLLSGRKMKGHYRLVKISDKNWLLFKSEEK